jgi:hypothetical protein
VVAADGIDTYTKRLFLEQAYAYQVPQVVLFELYNPLEARAEPRWLAPALAEMPWSDLRLKGTARLDPEFRTASVFPLLLTHARWPDIGGGAGRNALSFFKYGFPGISAKQFYTGGAEIFNRGRADEAEAPPLPTLTNNPRQTQVYAQNKAHIAAAARFAQRCGSRVVLLIAPLRDEPSTKPWQDLLAQTAAEIAQEVPGTQIIDMNQQRSAIGLTRDDFVNFDHLYIWGTKKATRWLGQRLRADYPELSLSSIPPDAATFWETNLPIWEARTDMTAPVSPQLSF